jgi:hypothetical protein
MIQHFYIISIESNLIYRDTPEKLLIHRFDELDRRAELRPPVLLLALQSIPVEAVYVLDSR